MRADVHSDGRAAQIWQADDAAGGRAGRGGGRTRQNGDAAALDAETEVAKGVKLRAELYERICGEWADFFGDPLVDGKVVPRESDYNFVGNKFQLGVRLKGSAFETFAQFQNSTLAALPANAVVPGRVFEGVGAVYDPNTPRIIQNGAFLRQGWLKLQHDGLYC